MFLAQVEPMTDADRVAIQRRLGRAPRARLVLLVLLILVGIALSLGAFVIIRNPEAGALVVLAMVMLLAGVCAGVVGILKLWSDLTLSGLIRADQAQLRQSLALGQVLLVQLIARRAWSLPTGDDDVQTVLVQVSEESLAIIPETDELRECLDRSVFPKGLRARMIQGESHTPLSVEVTNPDELAISDSLWRNSQHAWVAFSQAKLIFQEIKIKSLPAKLRSSLLDDDNPRT